MKKAVPIRKTPYYSWAVGKLPRGCQLCVQGKKLVLYVTGICSRRCYFCPLSDLRKDHDIVWANEMPITPCRSGAADLKPIFAEADACGSAGAGITGGDPLVRLDRTVRYIRGLKKRYGRGFHIHLYTPLEMVSEARLSALHDAGLDEIRFHPDLGSTKLWDGLRLAKRFRWDIGIEIPAIPGMEKQAKQLIDFAAGTIAFININELEISDTNSESFFKRGFAPKDRISYGVKGSERLAKKLLAHAARIGLHAHYCPTRLKDGIQLAERLKRRARNVAKGFDIITDEGMLVRGAVYTARPGVGYRRKMHLSRKKAAVLHRLLSWVRADMGIGKDLVGIDERKNRLLIHPQSLEIILPLLKKRFPQLIPAIVEEYPTWDGLEVEINFI
jgi:uncharacterized protein